MCVVYTPCGRVQCTLTYSWFFLSCVLRVCAHIILLLLLHLTIDNYFTWKPSINRHLQTICSHRHIHRYYCVSSLKFVSFPLIESHFVQRIACHFSSMRIWSNFNAPVCTERVQCSPFTFFFFRFSRCVFSTLTELWYISLNRRFIITFFSVVVAEVFRYIKKWSLFEITMKPVE